MIETRIILNKVSDINDFVNLAHMCTRDVTVYSGRYIVNGKSLMGIYSLNLSEPIKVEFHGDIPDEVKKGMKKFVVN